MTRSAAPTLRSRGRPAVRPSALVVAGAAGAAVLTWALAVPLLGVELRVGMEGAARTVGPGSVVAAAAVAGVLGWALLALLVRTVARAEAVWRAFAVAVLLLSLGRPVATGVGTASVVVLLALHVVVALVLVPLLPRAVQR
jgi:hypothetical protein